MGEQNHTAVGVSTAMHCSCFCEVWYVEANGANLLTLFILITPTFHQQVLLLLRVAARVAAMCESCVKGATHTTKRATTPCEYPMPAFTSLSSVNSRTLSIRCCTLFDSSMRAKIGAVSTRCSLFTGQMIGCATQQQNSLARLQHASKALSVEKAVPPWSPLVTGLGWDDGAENVLVSHRRVLNDGVSRCVCHKTSQSQRWGAKYGENIVWGRIITVFSACRITQFPLLLPPPPVHP